MRSSVDVVRLDGIDDEVVALGATAFQRQPALYRAYLEWKYLRNPYLLDPLIYVARDTQGRAVAMRGFYGARWRTPSGDFDMPCADDFAVAAAQRTTGVARELMRSALADVATRGVQYVVNASGGRATVLQSLAMGWKSVLAVDPFERPVARLRRGLQALQRRRSLAFLDGTAGVTAMPDASELADLACRCEIRSGVRHVRDAAFYRWRYANPEREYRFLVAEANGRITGYLAIGLQQPRATTLPLYFADWEAETPAVERDLLERGVALCATRPIRVWAAGVSAETRSQLERLGFVQAQLELRAQGMPCILVRDLTSNASGAGAIERADWNVRLIDSMHG